MKPLLFPLLLLFFDTAFAQSLDYISIRTRSGRVVKNVYTGSDVTVQLTDGSYLQGPVQAIRNDSLYLTLYDIRFWPTTWGGYVRDTIAITVLGMPYKEIKRFQLQRRSGFFRRSLAPMLKLGGGAYLAVNLLNGAFYNQPLTDGTNLRKVGISGGALGLGFLLQKLFAPDGFSGSRQRIVYVDL